eukprot:1281972-Prymnesium_polylepis.1
MDCAASHRTIPVPNKDDERLRHERKLIDSRDPIGFRGVRIGPPFAAAYKKWLPPAMLPEPDPSALHNVRLPPIPPRSTAVSVPSARTMAAPASRVRPTSHPA